MTVDTRKQVRVGCIPDSDDAQARKAPSREVIDDEVGVLASGVQEVGQTPRQLRVDEEPQAANTRIDFTSARRAAHRKQARRSSRSRSS